jgi:protein phosphatase
VNVIASFIKGLYIAKCYNQVYTEMLFVSLMEAFILEIYSKSDIGLTRETNQDWSEFRILGKNCVIAVVCDGVGGISGGGVASRIASLDICQATEEMMSMLLNKDDVEVIEQVPKNLVNSDSFKQKNSKTNFVFEIKPFLLGVLAGTSGKILKIGLEQPELSGLSTTVVAAVIFKNKLSIAHAGDSRAYMLKDDNLKQLTVDHSIVQELISKNQLSEDEAKKSINKNIITQALGMQNINPDFIQTEIKKGEKILLCTDGLTNYVDDIKIKEILSLNKDIKSIAEDLIEEAKSGGGKDNVTVTVILN